MLIEQAFFNLPEILVGSGYAKQDYEAGIVSAFSLALLQELNGRNVANPISCIHAERRFFEKEFEFRADLHVRLSSLMSGSKEYAEFGFRFNNWIEAKFFRLGAGATAPSTQNLGSVVADLIRLVSLVPFDGPINANKKQISGRYFLHAYRGDPLIHLNPNRKGKKSVPRAWVTKLLTSGEMTIDDFELSKEGKSFFKHIGQPLKSVKLTMSVTNFKLSPLPAITPNGYVLVLTRINEASIDYNGRSFSFKSDRSHLAQPAGSFDLLRDDIAKVLKPLKISESNSDMDDIEHLQVNEQNPLSSDDLVFEENVDAGELGL